MEALYSPHAGPCATLPPLRPGSSPVRVARMTDPVGLARLVQVTRADRALDATEVARAVQHPNLLAVQAVGESDDGPVLLTDWFGGAALAELLQVSVASRRRIPLEVALRILLDVCAGLEALHARGLVHGFVSPRSIHVGEDGIARLLDPRIGERKNLVPRRRRPELAYTAPECLGGDLPRVASDVFSISVIAWELLAQRRLFRGDRDPDTTRNVVAQPAPALSEVAPLLGKQFDEIVARGLAKEPLRRYPSVEGFAAALDAMAWGRGCVAAEAEVAACIHGLAPQALLRRDAILRALAAAPDLPPANDAVPPAVEEVAPVDLVPVEVAPPPEPEAPVAVEEPRGVVAPASMDAPPRAHDRTQRRLMVAAVVLTPVALVLLAWAAFLFHQRPQAQATSTREAARTSTAPAPRPSSETTTMRPLAAPTMTAAPPSAPVAIAPRAAATPRPAPASRSAAARPRVDPAPASAARAPDDARPARAPQGGPPPDDLPSNPYGS